MSTVIRRRRTAAYLVLIAASVVTTHAQTSRIDGGTATLKGFALYWETHLNPPTPALSASFGTTYDETAPNQVHRMLLDRSKRIYFGYTVRIEPQTEPNTFRLTFEPLSLTATSTLSPLRTRSLAAASGASVVRRGARALDVTVMKRDDSPDRCHGGGAGELLAKS